MSEFLLFLADQVWLRAREWIWRPVVDRRHSLMDILHRFCVQKTSHFKFSNSEIFVVPSNWVCETEAENLKLDDSGRGQWWIRTYRFSVAGLMGASKGSNICFPYSQKFMSDGSAIGAYLLQLDSTVGRERLRIAAGVEGRGRLWIKEPKPRTNKRETRLWLWFSYCISHRHMMLAEIQTHLVLRTALCEILIAW